MSHFTRMKTKLVKREPLVQALRDMGYEPQEGKVRIRGYGGQETEVKVMIPTGNPGYDLGFRKEGDTYEMVADWYGIRNIQRDSFLDRLQQRYAYQAVTARMREQGFEIVEEEDNTIRLTVRRAVF
jgi:hypothetical protein